MKPELIDDDFIGDEDETSDSNEATSLGQSVEECAKMARRRIEIMREERALKMALDDIFNEEFD